MVRLLPMVDRLPPRPEVAPLAELLKVLGDEHRLAIVALLARGELCVCHLMDILGLPQSTVSHHVRTPSGAGLVRARRAPRDARWTPSRLDLATTAARHGRLAELLALTGLPAEAAERPSPPCP